MANLFTNMHSMQESNTHEINKKRKRDETESNINFTPNKKLNISMLDIMPAEIKVHILQQAIKDIIGNNSIFEPSKGVKEFIKSIRLINKEFNNLEPDLTKFKIKYVKMHFAPEYLNSKQKEKDAQLKNIFKDAFQNIKTTSTDFEELEIEAAKLIIAGANPNLLTYSYSNGILPSEPLLMAIARACKFKNLIKLLIEYSAEVNVQRNNNTALMLAVDRGDIDIAKLLIDAGANVNTQDRNGHTALILAVKQDYVDMVKLLLSTYVDINAKGNDDEAVLMQSYRFDDILLPAEKGNSVNVDIQNNNGNTALIIAAQRGNVDIVKLLIDASADINKRNIDGDTALITAVKWKHKDVVIQLLINPDTDINLQNVLDKTALVYAVCYGYAEIMALLLASDADTSIPNKQGNTVLRLGLPQKYA